MKKLQNKQRLESMEPTKNWCIGLPKNFDQYPLGGFSNYVNEIGLINLIQGSLSKPVPDKAMQREKK